MLSLSQAIDVIEHKLKIAGQGRSIESHQLYDAMLVLLCHHKALQVDVSDKAEQFVRVNYDDSQVFPWVLVYGECHIWARYGTRENAMEEAKKLRDIFVVFCDWATKP